jgi:hypothetical protein
VVGLSLFLALALGVVVWLSRHDSADQAALDGPGAPEADRTRAMALLAGLESAVRRRDVSAGARLGGASGVRADLAGVVRNGRALHVTDFSLRLVGTAGAVAADGSWSADVATAWRFAAFDRRVVRLEMQVRFARSARGLRIAGIGGGDHRSPLWLSGPLQVRRAARSLVLVDGTPAQADTMAAVASRAVPQVRRVLPGWPGGLVVEMPASERELQSSLDARRGQYRGIAAVTTTVDGSRSRRSASHVYVNPRVFLPLQPQGAQVVITHEATHVATNAATSAAPIWLVEGFADFVALSSQRLPVSATGARIIALVRRQGVPRRLPGTAELAAGARHLEARYESAWLACLLLTREGGTGALVGLYRAVDAGHPLGPELRQRLGMAPAAFIRQWRSLLSHLPA